VTKKKRTREVVITGFRLSNNYLTSNIAYVSMVRVGAGGYTEEEIEKQVRDLVIGDGYGEVWVSQVERRYYRGVQRSEP
jgi:hypothetical protein